MHKPLLFSAAALAFALSAGTASAPAQAGIKCHGPNQVTSYGYIRTPYCEDTFLAKHAGVSPKALRHNPNLKSQVCKRHGFNPKFSGICDGHNDYGNRFR